MLTPHTAGHDHRNKPHKKTRLWFSHSVLSDCSCCFALELLGNRQRTEPELLVNKTAVGETEAEPATHPHGKKERRELGIMESLPNTMFKEF